MSAWSFIKDAFTDGAGISNKTSEKSEETVTESAFMSPAAAQFMSEKLRTGTPAERSAAGYALAKHKDDLKNGK